ncbi:dicarboxylate/amino acid:cation symporter [Desulfogranum marinum]|uniref:dicarboxylate/amino acid:cation symporter n=1 Tax=Desulfogranum marinum TaxID=453220 RepID=UPI0019630F24|nr:dicarboxylate/amino acid:cation symporter [Desulfogranum marinum]MBM9514397.1 dicarboxylate/amino acid:cation symporter [Desulfogranum marinum]
MKLFNWYFKSNLLLRIMLGLICGAVGGLVLGEEISWVSPFGDIFVRLLKMIVMPVVMFTLIVGAASVHPARLGRVGVKALGIYMVTTGFAVGLGLLFGNIFKPGRGLDLTGAGGEVAKTTLETPSLLDTVINIVPVNPFNAITSGEILPTIFFCLMFGIGIAFLRESEDQRIKHAATTVFHFFEGGAEIMYLVVHWILQYAPIGVFALIAVVFGTQGAEAFGPLGITTLAVYLAFLAHMFLVYGAGLAIFGLSPIKFFAKAKQAIVTGFVTRSSGGTLPVSMEVAEEEMGISKGVYSFSLPLGATINMDGTAIYQGVCAIFIGFAIGAPLSFEQQMTVIATAVLASIGTAGVPGAGALMLMMVLNSVGLQVEPGTTVAMAYAMIFGIDALLDMGRTACNITGDLAITCIVGKTEQEMDVSKWRS